MKALRFHEFGDPAQQLRLDEMPMPDCADDEVLVRLTARSINPSDLYTVMGTYGVRPELPAVGGNEGAGVVEQIGAAVQGFAPGDRVTLMLGAVGNGGTWREYVAVKPQWLLPTPAALSDEQAASAWVNYLTAWILAFEELDLKAEDRVLVTAGASHLGRAMLELANHSGFKVVATVRRKDQEQELLAAGALGVIATDSENIARRYRELTGQRGPLAAIDAVGGEIGSQVIAAMDVRGKVILYGMMSQEPWVIDGRVIFGEPIIQGFWLVRWLQRQSRQHIASVVAQLARLFADGTLSPAIDSSFALEDWAQAIERMNTPGRQGKVVLTSPRA